MREREKMGGGKLRVSAERNTQVLCSPAAGACICLLTEVLFCLHRGKGNHHLTKPRLCAVQQLKTDRETGKCEGETVWGSTADLWGCYAKSSRSNGCHSPVVLHLKASATKDRTCRLHKLHGGSSVLWLLLLQVPVLGWFITLFCVFFSSTALELRMFLKLCQAMQRSSMTL